MQVLRLRVAQAQTVVEYLLLLGVVTAIVLAGFNAFITRTHEKSNAFFDETAKEIMGDAIPSGVSNPSRTNYP